MNLKKKMNIFKLQKIILKTNEINTSLVNESKKTTFIFNIQNVGEASQYLKLKTITILRQKLIQVIGTKLKENSKAK